MQQILIQNYSLTYEIYHLPTLRQLDLAWIIFQLLLVLLMVNDRTEGNQTGAVQILVWRGKKELFLSPKSFFLIFLPINFKHQLLNISNIQASTINYTLTFP